eukprot:5072914-Prymnesium_polylepis.1
MALVELALILIYTCVLVIKTCQYDAEICSSYGFGTNANGVYLFFIFFGLSMLLVLLVVAVINLVLLGYVPKIILVGRAHGVSPSTVFMKVVSRRVERLKHQAVSIFHLDAALLTPQMALAVFEFRKTGAGSAKGQSKGVPEEVRPITVGSLAILHLKDFFPHTECFCHVDLESHAIRWTRTRCVSLHVVQDVQAQGIKDGGTVERRRPSSRVSSRMSRFSHYPMLSKAASSFSGDRISTSRSRSSIRPSLHGNRRTAAAACLITFSDRGGVSRVLELRLPEEAVDAWVEGFKALFATIPRHYSSAHWRWAQSCMAATGATDMLRRSKVWALLLRANASARLTSQQLDLFIRQVDKQDEELPRWLKGHRGRVRRPSLETSGFSSEQTSHGCHGVSSKITATATHSRLSARQVAGLLIRISNTSQRITELFDSHATRGRMRLEEWLRFLEREQLPGAQGLQGLQGAQGNKRMSRSMRSQSNLSEAANDDSTELENARTRFTRTASGLPQSTVSDGYDLEQFAQRLLSPENDASAAYNETTTEDVFRGLDKPLASFWTATSHNSCQRQHSNPCCSHCALCTV